MRDSVLAKVFAILYNKGRMTLEDRLMAVAARKSKAPAQSKSAGKPARARSAKDGAGKAGPALSNTPTFTKEEDLHAYREMLLIRRFEEKAGQMYGMGLIGGFCHLYIGQEAVVIGMQMASKDGDQVITGYRDHGHMLACGMESRGVMAELTGRRGGYSRGKGGSMHMFSREKNFYGGHGIVGAQVSLGTGLAFADWYRGDNTVSLTYFGDGAANQGQVYESFNMAQLWKLPVVFVIENNRYAMGTAVNRASAQTDFSRRGASFGIPGEQVDGMDVRAVRDAALRAIEHARSGKGPYILEMQTYRYRGHSMSDPAKYRSKDEVQRMREEHDPIEQVRARLVREFKIGEDELKAIDAKVREIVNDAAEFATHDPEPDPSELFTDILLEPAQG
ncbi:Pyruvate dehydrogenase E1 component subunit alpha OS=Bosea thiooxidans OX=53254 GN=pdhA PE=4 SV=1 [Bosea thiooxidans]|uniref:Pyruvate dehydrogenase E1 component subunit alpha n=2 Tax=Bosea thiooxidans TaxID=53254 RepID=A0A1T5CBY2_9HYPH|nr:pyruvate dehydrogenase E1 component alpha subunit [Bosea thiooxidans]